MPISDTMFIIFSFLGIVIVCLAFEKGLGSFSTKNGVSNECYLHKIFSIILHDNALNSNEFKDRNTSNITAHFSIKDDLFYIDIYGARAAHKGRYVINNTISYELSEHGIDINISCCNGVAISNVFILVCKSSNKNKEVSQLIQVIKNYNKIIMERKATLKTDLCVYDKIFERDFKDLFRSFLIKYRHIYTNFNYLECLDCYAWDKAPLLGEETIHSQNNMRYIPFYRNENIVANHIDNELELFIKLVCQKLDISQSYISIKFGVIQRLIRDAVFMMGVEITVHCSNEELDDFVNSINDNKKLKIFIENFFGNELKVNNKDHLISLLVSYLVNKHLIEINKIFSYFKRIHDIVNEHYDISKLSNFESLLAVEDTKSHIYIHDVDTMDGYVFEDLVAQIFKKNGYIIKQTSYSGDQGVDVIAQKNDEFIAIQVKRYSSKVDNSAIQQVVAGAMHYGCNKKMVITNNFFTSSAESLAVTNQVILWDRTKLIEVLNRFNSVSSGVLEF